MFSDFSAAVNGDEVFVRPGGNKIYAYQVRSSSWCELRKCPTVECPSIVIKDRLTLVGGIKGNTIVSQLFTLVKEGQKHVWREKYPPMPTNRWGSAALCTIRDLVIVAGGEGEGDVLLKVIEVMDANTKQWTTIAELPLALCYPTLIQCGDCIFLTGGNNKYHDPSRAVYKSSNLASIPTATSLGARLAGRVLAPVVNFSRIKITWTRVANLSVTYTACVSFNDHLLSIGGMDSSDQPTASIQVYNPASDRWEVISHMGTSRYDCFAAVSSDQQLVVIGGRTIMGKTNSVEAATAV